MKRATLAKTATDAPTSISIHALVKRATVREIRKRTLEIISIHALVKRATFDFGYLIPDKQFQSTPS